MIALRPGRDDDAPGFIALVGACWAEYPGAGLDVDGENPELRALASYFAEQDGALWVHEQDGRIAGMIGTRPLEGGAWELCKVYAEPGLRGTGLAQHLVATAEAFAVAGGAVEMQLWSDTKFDRAHRFYEKLGYIRSGPIRIVDDRSNTLEFAYMKPLAGRRVLALDVAGAGAAVPGLAAILCACVAAGDAVGYRDPLPVEMGRARFRTAARDVALGRAILLAAWAEGAMAGCALLGLDTPQTQPHCATLDLLLVRPGLRRRGIGRDLLAQAEAAALAAGRRLLTADTSATGAAFAQAVGWRLAGRIPGRALDAAGTPQDGLILYRAL